jgi:tartrate dehydrogenase/decarboxylase/D-malate dehydrogenase
MPSDALDALADFDAIYLGAVGHPDLQDHVTLNGLLLSIRRTFDQYVCERPSVLYPGIASPLRDKEPWGIDMAVIRENTEGEYANVGGFHYEGTPQEMAAQTSVFTRYGCERVIRFAFELAQQPGRRGKVTSVTKSNAMGYGMVLWDRVFDEVAREFPNVATESLLVDAACMDFIRRPEDFDVVVASNLFGDILTDIGAIITGSMGLAASGNIDPERRFPSMFEPVHGSAPDITGKGLANPLAMILSGAMMVRHLGREDAAAALERAVGLTLEAGDALTPDLGGSASTEEVGHAVLQALDGRQQGAAKVWWVYENLPRRRARLHVAECSFCNNGQGLHDSTAPTGRWYGPFTNVDAAIEQGLDTRAVDFAGCGVCQRLVGTLRQRG